MKKHLYYSLFTLHFSLFICLASCTPQKTETQEAVPTEQADNEIHSLPDYAYSDSLMLGNHKVAFTITGEPAEDLPMVVDEDGMKYKDNRFSLVVEKDGRKLFSRSFTRADFRNQLSKEFQNYGIMDGLRYSHSEDGKLYFNTSVSYPDSDMSCPFFLIIGPDGSYAITPDTSFDEDELPPAPAPPAE